MLVMEKCLNENELAKYADYLLYGAEKPDVMLLTHVEQCFLCKQELMKISDLMDEIRLRKVFSFEGIV